MIGAPSGLARLPLVVPQKIYHDCQPFPRTRASRAFSAHRPGYRPGGVSGPALERVRRQVYSEFMEAQAAAPCPELAASLPTASTTRPRALPDIWPSLAAQHGDSLAILDPHAPSTTRYTFSELSTEITTAAAGLRSLGLAPGALVSLFAENSGRWLVIDQAIQKCGAADAVRGVSSPAEELAFIATHSRSSGIVVQDASTLEKLLPALSTDPLASSISFVVLLWGEEVPTAAADALRCPVLPFSEVLARGRALLAEHNQEIHTPLFPPSNPAALATLVYTSGTTGHPKGVCLSHSNLLYQVEQFPAYLNVQPGQRTLSLLPPWHIYERSVAHHVLSRGAGIVVSSVAHFKKDLGRYPPDFLVCVPLVLETLRSRIFATLRAAPPLRRAIALTLLAAATAAARARRVIDGTDLRFALHPPSFLEYAKNLIISIFLAPLVALTHRLVTPKIRIGLGVKECVVSGGGSLAPHLDDFYQAIGLPVLNGYGLTETSPVLACRSSGDAVGANVRGSVGRVIPGGTEIKIVDPETLKEEPDGRQGLLLARGPGVTDAYFDDATATAAAFSTGDGWFNTGDLGWRAPDGVKGSAMAGCLVLTGRAKDTIVLTGGENVEPGHIEDAICASPFVKFATVIGAGHRSLGALLVPDADALAAAATARGVVALPAEEVRGMLRHAVAEACEGRVRWEHIAAIEVLERPYSYDDGTLTRTMKPRRAAIMEAYAAQVKSLEAKLR